MHIHWLGGTTVKLQVKPADKDITVVIDPYKPKKGSFPRSLAPDIGIYTRGTDGSITLSGDPFIFGTPGEIETQNVLISAAAGHDPGTTMFRLDAEGISLGHIGRTNKQLTDAQLGVLSDVDVLLVPVGANDVYDVEQATKVVNTIDPRVVIPICFKSENDPTAEPVTGFLKEIGAATVAPEKKTIVKKSSLPQEETSVIVLEKE